jgi:Glu/Leu/Phe/Val dehydrogenase, dimerisation domain
MTSGDRSAPTIEPALLSNSVSSRRLHLAPALTKAAERCVGREKRSSLSLMALGQASAAACSASHTNTHFGGDAQKHLAPLLRMSRDPDGTCVARNHRPARPLISLPTRGNTERIDRLRSPTEHFPGLTSEAADERIVLANDASTGLQAIIAIYSMARGPALGGCRYRRYVSEHEAFNYELRPSQGMAFENALPDPPFGGDKAVVLRRPEALNRTELFKAFGRLVQSLDGLYLVAEDVDTAADDMRTLRSETRHQLRTGISRCNRRTRSTRGSCQDRSPCARTRRSGACD